MLAETVTGLQITLHPNSEPANIDFVIILLFFY